MSMRKMSYKFLIESEIINNMFVLKWQSRRGILHKKKKWLKLSFKDVYKNYFAFYENLFSNREKPLNANK